MFQRKTLFGHAWPCLFAAAAIALATQSASAQDGLPTEVKDFLKQDFMQADLDGDGVINKAEIVATLQRDFRDMDVNNDGVVTLADHPPDIPINRLDRAELEYDANGDEVVTMDEYVAAMSPMVGEMDTDKNGLVSLDEMHGHHEKLWNANTQTPAQ